MPNAPAWTDPTNAVPSFEQLMGNLLWLYGKVNDFQGTNPKVSAYVPGYRVTDDGKGYVLQLNGIDATGPVALPVFSRHTGDYVVGRTYEEGDIVFNPADGSSYFASRDFTSATSAQSDIDAGTLKLEVQGIAFPLDSKKVRDATQAKTLDVILADFAAAIASNAAQVAANTANISAINSKLGDDGVAGFPLVLQQPAASGASGSTGSTGSGSSGSTGSGSTGTGSTGTGSTGTGSGSTGSGSTGTGSSGTTDHTAGDTPGYPSGYVPDGSGNGSYDATGVGVGQGHGRYDKDGNYVG